MLLLTSGSARESEGDVIEELDLSGSSEGELDGAVSHCLVSPDTDGEVGWVHVVAHLETALVPQLHRRCLYLCNEASKFCASLK